MSKYLVYALKDPKTNEIRYIGKSSIGMKRINQHKKPSELIKNTHKNNWIKSLHKQGLEFTYEVLEFCKSEEQVMQQEMYWIKFYRDLGTDLTNLTDGGEGNSGWNPSDEIRKKMSEAAIQKHKNNPELREQIAQKQRKQHEIINNIECKHCADCHEYKPLADYSKSLGNWDELKHICKSCNNKRTEQYRQKTFIPLNEQEWKQSYVDRNKNMTKGVQAHYDANPEAKEAISKRMSKPVIGTCVTTGKEIRFESALKAKEAGFNNTNLGVAIKEKKTYKGYTWKKA